HTHRRIHSFPTRRSSDLTQHADDDGYTNDHSNSADDHGSNGCTASFSSSNLSSRFLNISKRRRGNNTGTQYQHTSTNFFEQLIQDRKSTRLNSSHVKISY